jgi:Raf kinase inhibitor-like YbhB/YbcL family protein
MKHRSLALAAIATLLLPMAAFAQAPAAPPAGGAAPPAAGATAPKPVGPLANTILKPSTTTALTVTSSALMNNGQIPVMYTQAGMSTSLPLTWTAGPAGTKSYVVLTEDAGAGTPDPITHWIVFNIPADVTALPAGIPNTPTVDNPKVSQGVNTGKKAGYLGMGPPAGSSHPYHFEVYALDTTLTLDPTKADRPTLLAAMMGHVLSTGELVGNFMRP